MRYLPKQYAVCLYEATIDLTEAKLKPVLEKFVSLLYQNNDLSKVGRVIKVYREYYNRQQGIKEIKIYLAREMKGIETVYHSLERKFSPVRIETKVKIQSNLIGGARIRIEDDVIDGSVKRNLETMRELLANAAPLAQA